MKKTVRKKNNNESELWFNWLTRQLNSYEAFKDFDSGQNPEDVAENFIKVNSLAIADIFNKFDDEDKDTERYRKKTNNDDRGSNDTFGFQIRACVEVGRETDGSPMYYDGPILIEEMKQKAIAKDIHLVDYTKKYKHDTHPLSKQSMERGQYHPVIAKDDSSPLHYFEHLESKKPLEL